MFKIQSGTDKANYNSSHGVILGAVLLSKLLTRVSKILKCEKIRAFCDSTIVLAWLKGPSSKYQVFVRNRVEYVNSILPYSQWQYVNTAENPADLITRSLSVKSFQNNSLWINGPTWISEIEYKPSSIQLPEDVPEVRAVCHVTVCQSQYDEKFITRYPDFDRLVQIAALVWKYLSRLNLFLTKYRFSAICCATFFSVFSKCYFF